MTTFLTLLFINYLLDYPLQGLLGTWKVKYNYALLVHCFMWAWGLCLGLMFFGIFAWWKFCWLFAGHLLMDGWKCRHYYKWHHLSDMQALYIDQAFHVFQIVLCLV